ncbi:hypothetical protein PAHAL_9G206000 [Panicum hallii]|uniref:Secreted protein n=1 Tax=Panicum hallii TaxID=206008 RepID=A0A2T8I1W5_9POAL|nr:hypothetical protein PAHAL_9G206000 [Panicum hallii]
MNILRLRVFIAVMEASCAQDSPLLTGSDGNFQDSPDCTGTAWCLLSCQSLWGQLLVLKFSNYVRSRVLISTIAGIASIC